MTPADTQAQGSTVDCYPVNHELFSRKGGVLSRDTHPISGALGGQGLFIFIQSVVSEGHRPSEACCSIWELNP